MNYYKLSVIGKISFWKIEHYIQSNKDFIYIVLEQHAISVYTIAEQIILYIYLDLHTLEI